MPSHAWEGFTEQKHQLLSCLMLTRPRAPVLMAAAGQTEPVRRISRDHGDEKSSDLSHETLM